MSIDIKVEDYALDAVISINRRGRQPVLIQNGADDEKYTCPGIFMAGEASISKADNRGGLVVKITSLSPVYWLTNGGFVQRMFSANRQNFFPGLEGSRIAIGYDDVVKALKEQYCYNGPLPKL